ncbi:hypothetical protein [Streptomyces spiramenti]|uniref:AMP-dependent synthetase/ligase domain-containing protein n=1 Tax=Streptomyces spiramenti TaxID=2720606 RepID=A0ABX1AXK6_9ACTN|nr:hypothetical protein [Streptomyces spiramenti]NJP69122.1 hypothetical protein [Streptomyces spiramenti]
MDDMTPLEVSLGAVRETPEQTVVHLRSDRSELTVTLAELLADAMRVAGGLAAAGVAPGTCVPLLADRSEDPRRQLRPSAALSGTPEYNPV